MRNGSIVSVLAFCVLTPLLAHSQPAGLPPVPSAIRNARTVFVSNAGADSGLFPQPFTGDPNRGYMEFYSNLKATGQFQLVDDPAAADVVVELQLTAPSGPSKPNKINGAADPLPMFRLTIWDRKTHFVLWTLTESIDFALTQKSHDRNFDSALDAIVEDFERLTGKTPPAARP